MARQRSGAAAAGAAIDSMLSQDGPLDEHEQQELIRGFEELQVSQARTFRAIFGAGAALGAAFFLYAAREQALRPWETRYVGELRPFVPGGTAAAPAAALLLQAAALAAAAGALLARLPRAGRRDGGGTGDRAACVPGGRGSMAALAAGAAAAAGGALFWGAAMRRAWVKHGPELGAHWELLWLPLGPLACVALCHYVMRSAAATARDVERLRAMTYDYKKV
jgi:hypothetical protein